MRILPPSPGIAVLGCALIFLTPLILRGAEAHQPYPGVDVILKLTKPEFNLTVRTDGNGIARFNVGPAGQYTLVVQPLPKNRMGNYNPERLNTAGITIAGAAEAVAGSYNFTGMRPYQVVIDVAHSATLTIAVTPPPPPKNGDEVPPAMQ
jgi:hypothetical protein